MTLQSDNARLRKMLRQSARDWDQLNRIWNEITSLLIEAQKDRPQYSVAARVKHAIYLLNAHDFNIGPKIRDGLKQMEESCEKTGD